jgi:hypothetical protein
MTSYSFDTEAETKLETKHIDSTIGDDWPCPFKIHWRAENGRFVHFAIPLCDVPTLLDRFVDEKRQCQITDSDGNLIAWVRCLSDRETFEHCLVIYSIVDAIADAVEAEALLEQIARVA